MDVNETISVAGLQAKLSKIPKVPLLLRDDNNKSDDYDPKVVSIGPYHHGKNHLKFVENFKKKALEMFIEKSVSDYTYFFQEILDRIEYARSCYVEDYRHIPDNEFAWMMLLDACFILNEIEISSPDCPTPVASGKKRTTLEHLGTSFCLMARRDLYLLENQVPFWILNLLVSLRYDYLQGKQFVKNVEKYCYGMFFDKPEEEELESERSSTTSRDDQYLPSHLLEIFRRVITRGNYHPDTSDEPYVFRSVTELKSMGIHFRPSKVNSLKEGVTFPSGATLTLPRWYVSIYTRIFFANMIAYEFDPYSTKYKTVSAYVNFMKSLLNSPDDVKVLREKKILLNSLGSDSEVIQVYSSLNTYGLDDPYLFMDVKRKISKHCDNKAKTWFAEFTSTYFSSPWSAIAFIAAILVFILDAIQTYYAIQEGGNPKTGSGSGSNSGSGY